MQNTALYEYDTKWEHPLRMLPNLYANANSFRKKNRSTLLILFGSYAVNAPEMIDLAACQKEQESTG